MDQLSEYYHQAKKLWAEVKKHRRVAATIPIFAAIYCLVRIWGDFETAIRMAGLLWTIIMFFFQAPVLLLMIFGAMAYIFKDLWTPYLAPVIKYLPASTRVPQTWIAPQTFKAGVHFGSPEQTILSLGDTLRINAPNLEIGNRGDIILGSQGNDVLPEMDNSVDFGSLALRYKDGWFTRLHIHQATTNASSPPTDAELDSAFGVPAMLGNGFTGIIAGAGSAVWLCISSGNSWHYIAMTNGLLVRESSLASTGSEIHSRKHAG